MNLMYSGYNPHFQDYRWYSFAQNQMQMSKGNCWVVAQSPSQYYCGYNVSQNGEYNPYQGQNLFENTHSQWVHSNSWTISQTPSVDYNGGYFFQNWAPFGYGTCGQTPHMSQHYGGHIYSRNGTQNVDWQNSQCPSLGQNSFTAKSPTLTSVQDQLPFDTLGLSGPKAKSVSCEAEITPTSSKPEMFLMSCGLEENLKKKQCHLMTNYLHEKPVEEDQNVATSSKTDGDCEYVHHEQGEDLPDCDLTKSENIKHPDILPYCEATASVNIKPKYKLGCDNSCMIVETSDQSAKKLCCPFCEKLFSKLARHMEKKHSQEPDVKRFLNFPKASKERRAIQDSLRKIGGLNFNKNAELNKGQLITSRRPNRKHNRKAINHTTCPYCFGSYAKSGISFHIKYKCPQKPINDERTEDERLTSSLAASVEARYHENASPALQQVFQKLRTDDIVLGIRFDWFYDQPMAIN